MLPVLGLCGRPHVHNGVQFEVVDLKNFVCIVFAKRRLLLTSGGIDELLGILLQKHNIISHAAHAPHKQARGRDTCNSIMYSQTGGPS